MSLRFPFLFLIGALALQAQAIAQEPAPASPAVADESVMVELTDETLPPLPPDTAADGDDALDVDLGPVSAAARRMLDRVRDSVFQIRGFYGTNRSEAFHGSAFAIAPGGILITNYHVIARAALFPGITAWSITLMTVVSAW